MTGLLDDEGVMMIYFIHNQVDGCSFQGSCVEFWIAQWYLNNSCEGTQEEHDEKKRRNDNLAPHHFQNQTVESGRKDHNWLLIALELIEDQEQGVL